MSKFHSFKSTSASTPSSVSISAEAALLAAMTANTTALLSTITSTHAAETAALKELGLAAISADPANGGAIVAAYVEVRRLHLEAEAAAATTAATFLSDLLDKVVPIAAAVAEAEGLKARAALATAEARQQEAANRSAFAEIEKIKAEAAKAAARREH